MVDVISIGEAISKSSGVSKDDRKGIMRLLYEVAELPSRGFFDDDSELSLSQFSRFHKVMPHFWDRPLLIKKVLSTSFLTN